MAFVGTGIIVWVLNWVICYSRANLVGLAPGYATGLISGSYTIPAILGVGQSALVRGAYKPPAGMTVEQVGANMAAAYVISYVLSTVGIIWLIRYLPRIFGRDTVGDAQPAEADFSGGGIDPVPGTFGALTLGFSPFDLHAFTDRHTQELHRPCPVATGPGLSRSANFARGARWQDAGPQGRPRCQTQ